MGFTLTTHGQEDRSYTFLTTADPEINIPKWGTTRTEKILEQPHRQKEQMYDGLRTHENKIGFLSGSNDNGTK